MDTLRITQAYYRCFLGISESDFARTGITFEATPQRVQRQAGYATPFAVYAYLTPDAVHITCRQDLLERLWPLVDNLPADVSAADLSARLSDALNAPAVHVFKYVFVSPAVQSTQAMRLSLGDYSAYEAFFREVHPGAKVEGWLRPYFDEMVASGTCWGIWRDGQLVCCTDSPSTPFMADRVSEIGINTVPAWQGKRLATDACAAHIAHLLSCGLCPVWSTSADNTASDRLALRLGFARLADIVTVTL